MKASNGNKLQIEQSLVESERVRRLEKETQELKMKNKALKIDKNILMKMIKDMIDKNPEALKAIDQEKFMKTLEDA
jgi:predicted transcriptional regulator